MVSGWVKTWQRVGVFVVVSGFVGLTPFSYFEHISLILTPIELKFTPSESYFNYLKLSCFGENLNPSLNGSKMSLKS